MSKIQKLIHNPYVIFTYPCFHGWFNWLSDKAYLKLLYHARLGKKLNLNNPKTFNEKVQWLKLYDRKSEYSVMVDKYLVKDYVSKKIGSEYVVPLYGVWNNVEEIDFSILPKQFVLKCTHDCGGMVICKDKSMLDEKSAREILRSGLKKKYYKIGREWPYVNVIPRIIAEQYLEDSATKELRDYKFFAFNGEVKALFIASDRQKKDEETKFDFYDENFQHLSLTNGHPNAPIPPKKPIQFELMKKLAAELSRGIPHVRVDFYEVDEKVYFGELTFSHWSGIVPFKPEKWDSIFGSWIDLSIVSKKNK